MENEKLGVEGIKKVLAFPLSLHMAFEAANADGKINVADIGLLMNPVMKLTGAIPMAKQAFEEIKDLDEVERADIMQWSQAEYDISDDVLEEKVEAGIDLALAVAKFVGVVS